LPEKQVGYVQFLMCPEGTAEWLGLQQHLMSTAAATDVLLLYKAKTSHK
jgi:hypothetical protein